MDLRQGVLVSVILPAYNAADGLSQAIESVRLQTYKNFELIVVDDGSTDETWAAVEHFANLDPRIVPIQKQNGGVSSARNVGLSNAVGEFIAFLDADDAMEPNMLEALVDAQEESNADCVRCGYFAVDPLSQSSIVVSPRSSVLRTSSQKAEHLTSTIQGKQAGHAVWTVFLRREIAQAVRFDERLDYGEDLVFLLEVISQSASIQTIATPLYRYKLEPESAVRKPKNAVKILQSIPVATMKVRLLMKSDSSVSSRMLLKSERARARVLGNQVLKVAIAEGVSDELVSFLINGPLADEAFESWMRDFAIYMWVRLPWLALLFTRRRRSARVTLSVADWALSQLGRKGKRRE